MSEVHRYKAVKMLTEAGSVITYSPHGPYVVPAVEYDRDTQALRDKFCAQCERTGRMADERDQLAAENQQLRGALEAFDTAAKTSGSIIGFAAQSVKLLKGARSVLAAGKENAS